MGILTGSWMDRCYWVTMLISPWSVMHHHGFYSSARLHNAVHHCSLPARLLWKLSCHSSRPASLTLVFTVQQLTPAEMCSGVPQSWVRRTRHVIDRPRMEGLRSLLLKKQVLLSHTKLWPSSYWNFPITKVVYVSLEPGAIYAEGQILQELVSVRSSGLSSLESAVAFYTFWNICCKLYHYVLKVTHNVHTGWHETHFCRYTVNVYHTMFNNNERTIRYVWMYQINIRLTE